MESTSMLPEIVKASDMNNLERRTLIEFFILKGRTRTKIEVIVDPAVIETIVNLKSMIGAITEVKEMLESQLEATEAGKNADIQEQLKQLQESEN